MTWQCPTCGHEMQTPTPLAALEHAPLASQERIIMEILVGAHPRKVSRDQLTDILYRHDPNGGPITASKTVTVLMHRLRRKIGPYGWTIPRESGGRGKQARYGLAPLDVGGVENETTR